MESQHSESNQKCCSVLILKAEKTFKKTFKKCLTKSKQRSIIALALLRLATSNEENKRENQVFLVQSEHRTLKIEQRENSKETRNDFEESSKDYSEMYTKKHQELRI